VTADLSVPVVRDLVGAADAADALDGAVAAAGTLPDGSWHGPPLTAAALADITARLLETYPDASVAAIGDNGLYVPMPATVPLGSHPLMVGHTSALELVDRVDIIVVIDAWKRALSYGVGVCEVHPAGDPDTLMTLYLLDARAQYGVLLGLAVHPGGGPVDPEHTAGDLLRPRVSAVRKNRIAEFVDVDAAAEVLLGYRREELIGRPNLELIHPDDQPRAIANWIDMLGAPGASRRVRLRQQHRDGHWIWFEVTNHNRLNDPAEACILTEMIDISDEMGAQENLRASQQLLLRLTESLPVGVLQIDLEGTVAHQNQRASQILGCPPAPTFAGLFGEVIDGDRAALQEALDTVLRQAQDVDVEVGVRHRSGDLVRCRLSLRTLINDDGAATGAIVCVDDVTEGVRLREQLEVRATYDALTGCHNRASVLAGLQRALTEAADQRTGVAVVFVDLDGFKSVNDTRGHTAGDALLKLIGRHLRDGARRDDIVGRVGGDEFLVVGRAVESADEAMAMGQRVAAALARGAVPVPPHAAVASIGVAWTPGAECAGPAGTGGRGGVSADSLVARADRAMYESKRAGLGRPVMCDGQ
jgi:diguanylate cyclase (GGDEF)-like protein/PAS domain S-box-containing protein